jgi:mono/diheme cytochrome c family protein
MRAHLFLVTIATAAVASTARADDRPAPQAAEFFESKVRPVLAENCFSCHGPEKQKGDLRLDSRAALLKGAGGEPVVVPGDPDKSILVKAVRHDGDTKMPPKKKLPDPAIEALAAWVKMGAPWPETTAGKGASSVAEAQAQHWSFRPVRKPALPPVRRGDWARTPIDLFVLAKLEQRGLEPAPRADRRTLIRRVALDLTGLPPEPAEVEAFVNDPSPDAWEKVIDRLLASPRYGERWGRHWLDVARYADTKGYLFEEERRYPFAYTYRDYVIRAFNDDLPYDQFVNQQIAADKLPAGDDKRPLAAMGFLTLGRRFLNNTPDIIDDRIDVVMRGLQGLTVGCARCHDHKFDPIPMRDYYSLYGVFASSVEPKDLPVLGAPAPTPAYLAYEKELTALKQAVTDYEEKNKDELQKRNRKARDELRKLQKKVDTLKVTHPGAPPQAMVLTDLAQPVDPVVFLRGNPNNHGPAVPRQFLEVLSRGERKPFTDGSGRLDLARAIASKDNPLTARVMVNRVWLHHFGKGLVTTPGDFGLRGDPPTHPELLDYLAWSFTEEGWSVKQLHRMILRSATYLQSSAAPQAADPDNRLLSHQNRQRLDFEALRDSLLWASGRLDTKAGGAPVEITTPPFAARRSVYGFIDRQNLPGLFRTFDFASPDSSTPQRHVTTVPQQALFLMNGPFVVQQAKALAAQPDVTACTDAGERIAYLYRLLYGRPPDADEAALGRRFVESAGTEKALSPWEKYCQVLLMSNEFAFVD